MTTGIYVNPNRKETALQAEELAATLVSRGFGCRKIFRLSEKETEGLDILLVLGGDGTILRCAEICARAGIKIVGINYGTVGFLAEFEKDELPSVPDFLLKLNEAKEIKRNLLKVTYKEKTFYCLNEAALRRRSTKYRATARLYARLRAPRRIRFPPAGRLSLRRRRRFCLRRSARFLLPPDRWCSRKTTKLRLKSRAAGRFCSPTAL